MISATFNDASFNKLMNNIVQYSLGFAEGMEKGQPRLLSSIGDEVIAIMEKYLDSNAKVDPASMGHVYEWDSIGDATARLFELDKQVSRSKVKIFSRFLPSQSIKEGSKEPFVNKASIMENGIPVTIKPVSSSVLVFDQNGETVFTSREVRVSNPGGDAAQGGFENAFNSFFDGFASQAILQSGNIASYLKKPVDYVKNLRAGSVGGKMVGLNTGYNWISRAGRLFE